MPSQVASSEVAILKIAISDYFCKNDFFIIYLHFKPLYDIFVQQIVLQWICNKIPRLMMYHDGIIHVYNRC